MDKNFLTTVLFNFQSMITIADEQTENLDNEDIKSIGKAEYVMEQFIKYIKNLPEQKVLNPSEYDVVKGEKMITKELKMIAVIELVSGRLISNNYDSIKELIEELTDAPVTEFTLISKTFEICKSFLLDKYLDVCFEYIHLNTLDITEIYTLRSQMKNKILTVQFDRYPTPENYSFFN